MPAANDVREQPALEYFGPRRGSAVTCRCGFSTPDSADDAFRLRMDVAHFNKLAGPGFQVPRFLTLVIVPESNSDYAICSDEHMQLGTAAYWASLADVPERSTGPDDPRTVLVDVPRRNSLTVASLGYLLLGDVEEAAR